MRYIRCANDHFYDADQYSTCPICAGGGAVNETVAFTNSFDDAKTTPLGAGAGPTVPINDTVPGVTIPIGGGADDDDQKTVFFDEITGQKPPVVGWLVCTAGTHKGEDFRLTVGKNSIGRGADMDVSLSGENTVSRDKHAIVVYEPVQNIFLALPGDAKELFYLNGDVVLSAQRLKRGDRIGIGQVELMFIPCCGEDFTWA